MIYDRLSRPATGARTPRAVVLLGAVIVLLVGCSADGRSDTDSVVAIEEAQAEAAAEVAEVQAAIDRQVEAADAQKAEGQAAADEAAQQAPVVAATEKAAADRAAAAKAAADRAAVAKAAADRAAAAKAAAVRVASSKGAAGGAASTGTRPPQRTPAGSKKATPRATGAKKVLTAPVPRSQPVATRPARAATIAPAIPKSRPAATKPAQPPQGTVSSTTDIDIVVAPGGTISVPGDASVAAGCLPQDFHAGDRVLLTTASGATVHETVLPACQREVLAAPGTGVSISSPRFSVTLPGIAWRDGDAWVLQIGTHRWPVTAATLSAYGWSIAVTAQAGVTAGPTGSHEMRSHR